MNRIERPLFDLRLDFERLVITTLIFLTSLNACLTRSSGDEPHQATVIKLSPVFVGTTQKVKFRLDLKDHLGSTVTHYNHVQSVHVSKSKSQSCFDVEIDIPKGQTRFSSPLIIKVPNEKAIESDGPEYITLVDAKIELPVVLECDVVSKTRANSAADFYVLNRGRHDWESIHVEINRSPIVTVSIRPIEEKVAGDLFPEYSRQRFECKVDGLLEARDPVKVSVFRKIPTSDIEAFELVTEEMIELRPHRRTHVTSER